MIQLFTSVQHDKDREMIDESLKLYTELFDTLFVDVCDPYCASLYIVDHIEKAYIPSKTILLGFDVQGYHSIPQNISVTEIVKKIRLILNKNTIDPEFISLKSKRVKVNDIVTIETVGRGVVIHTTTEETKTYHPIYFWKKLLWMWPFIEVYRGILVNMNAVKKLEEDTLVLKNEKRIPVSRRKHKEVEAHFKKEKETL